MAVFNPTPNPTSDPSYIGQSKQYDRLQSDKSLGTLFSGLGDLLEGGTTAIDESNKHDIRKSLQSGADEIRGAAGVDTATNAASQGTTLFDGSGAPKAPAAVEGVADDINKLTAARNEGKLNDSYYWGRVNALVKQVRTNYPGYRDYIDQTISNIVGTNPANALRKAVQNEYDSAQALSTQQSNKWESFIHQNMEHLPPDYFKREAEGKPYGKTEIEEYVRNSQYSDAAVKRENAQLELKAKAGNLKAEDAQGEATFRANQYVQTVIGQAMKALGNDAIKALQEGKPLPPDKLQEFQANVQALTAKAQVGLNALLNKPFTDDSTNTFASIIKDGKKLEDIQKNALGQLTSITSLIGEGKGGLANMNANIAKASLDYDMARLMQTSEAARKVQVARELAGPAGLNTLLNMQTGGYNLLSDTAKGILSLNMAESIAGEGNSKVQLDRLKNPKTGKVDPAAARQFLKDKVATLTSTDIADPAVINAFKTTFGEGNERFLESFAPADRKTVYMQLTSPEVTKNIARLKQTDPAAFDSYKKWAESNFYPLLKTDADTVQSFITNDNSGKVVFDPKTFSFQVQVNPDFKPPLGSWAAPGREGLTPEKLFDVEHGGLRRSLNEVNQRLQALKPIYDAEGGNANEKLISLITKINPDSPQAEGFLGMLWKGLKNTLLPEAKAEEGKGNPNTEFVTLKPYTPEETKGAKADELVSLSDSDFGDLVSLKGSNLKQATGETKDMLDMIGNAEAPKGYNQIFGKNREAPLDNMTVSEVLDLQDQMKSRGSPSTAVGRYQFIQGTLRGLVKALGIDPSEKFTPELQDQLAHALLIRRGYNEWKAGKISDEKFQNNLAQEWASLPTVMGKSFYEDDGLNHALVGDGDVKRALGKLKRFQTAQN